MSQSHPRPRSTGRTCCLSFVIAAFVLVVAGAGGLYLALNNIDWLKKKTGAAWEITYEAGVKGGGAGGARATQVTYALSPDRTEDRTLERRAGAVALPWKEVVQLRVGETARVVVTPAPGATATCRVVLDGVRTVAEGVSPAPGKPAVCSVVTSPTPEKWPR
ncbi:hypothetical protein ABT160_21850 [Streptomyces sp. NPDC001941]|uniref:hypothetical protein n=1 Tax=Streptomyces sp. NPDC001941 TaxID=3154659 RepID=UPI0033187ADB